MSMPNQNDIDPKQLNDFLEAGAQFFRFNGSKNTPNILQNFAERVSDLRCSIDNASESSSRLAGKLNLITWLLVAVGLIQIIVQVIPWLLRH
jgi:hypothetical protein